MKKIIAILMIVAALLCGCNKGESVEDAYQRGYEDGLSAGYREGYEEGLDAGFDDGFQQGYEACIDWNNLNLPYHW